MRAFSSQLILAVLFMVIGQGEYSFSQEQDILTKKELSKEEMAVLDKALDEIAPAIFRMYSSTVDVNGDKTTVGELSNLAICQEEGLTSDAVALKNKMSGTASLVLPALSFLLYKPENKEEALETSTIALPTALLGLSLIAIGTHFSDQGHSDKKISIYSSRLARDFAFAIDLTASQERLFQKEIVEASKREWALLSDEEKRNFPNAFDLAATKLNLTADQSARLKNLEALAVRMNLHNNPPTESVIRARSSDPAKRQEAVRLALEQLRNFATSIKDSKERSKIEDKIASIRGLLSAASEK